MLMVLLLRLHSAVRMQLLIRIQSRSMTYSSFSDGVSGQPDLRFLTFIGHKLSQSPVQFAATADAASTGGSQVTVNITPPLQVNSGQDQNINNAIVAGMQVTVLPNHRCGLIYSGDPIVLGDASFT